MPRCLLPALLLAGLLAACQSEHDGATAEDETARASVTTDAATLGEESAPQGAFAADEVVCNADPVQGLVGQRASDEIVAQALKDSGASVPRVLKPDTPATLDLSPSRLNILTDDNGVIQSLHCG